MMPDCKQVQKLLTEYVEGVCSEEGQQVRVYIPQHGFTAQRDNIRKEGGPQGLLLFLCIRLFFHGFFKERPKPFAVSFQVEPAEQAF